MGWVQIAVIRLVVGIGAVIAFFSGVFVLVKFVQWALTVQLPPPPIFRLLGWVS